MSWVDLRVGYRCNNRCRFCDQGDLRERVVDASTEAVRAALVAAGPGDGVWLAGGEVTLRPDLPALVGAAREAGFRRVGLQTNGRVLASKGAAAGLQRLGVTDVVVALHGPDAAIHDWLTGEAGSFAQALAGARHCVAAGIELRIATVVTRSLGDALPALAARAARLGARGHRWILCREEGIAVLHARSLVPRLAQIEAPLARALALGEAAGLEVETVGFPLCVLPRKGVAAADRLDAPPVRRVWAAGGTESEGPRAVKADACAGCALGGVCAGVAPLLLARWGDGALHPQRPEAAAPPQSGSRVFLPVQAPCALKCAGCATRAAFAGGWPQETTRGLRQRIVRAWQAETVVFAGASPWDHPELPAMVREAVRLGVPRVEVWGPLHPVAALRDPDLERLAGLAAVVAPLVPDAVSGVEGAQAAAHRGAARLAAAVPGCAIRLVASEGPSDQAPPGRLAFAHGALATWAGCQPG